MPIFDVVAWFGAPVDGRACASTRDPRAETVAAETPEAAARKFLWRLRPAEREATVRVVVWAPKPKLNLPLHVGPEVRFRREGSRLVEIGDGPDT